MKKFVSLMVAVMMLCCLTVTAFAGSQEVPVATEVTPTSQQEQNANQAVADKGLDTSKVEDVVAYTAPATDVAESTPLTLGGLNAFKGTTRQMVITYTDSATNTVKTAVVSATVKDDGTVSVALPGGVKAGTAITAAVLSAIPGGAAVINLGGGSSASGTAAGVSPQTGETNVVYAIGALVLAAACAAFVVKSRKVA